MRPPATSAAELAASAGIRLAALLWLLRAMVHGAALLQLVPVLPLVAIFWVGAPQLARLTAGSASAGTDRGCISPQGLLAAALGITGSVFLISGLSRLLANVVSGLVLSGIIERLFERGFLLQPTLTIVAGAAVLLAAAPLARRLLPGVPAS